MEHDIGQDQDAPPGQSQSVLSQESAGTNLVYETPDMNVEYVERITKLGESQGYETERCPHCSKFVWIGWGRHEFREAKL